MERAWKQVRNHDVLMERLSRRIEDKPLLRLIRRFLVAGIMVDGVITDRHEGTPQGGPLSPLLANVLLDEWDKSLEGRGHRFCRYADDCNIYVRSRKAGERVMAWCRRLLERKLKGERGQKRGGSSLEPLGVSPAHRRPTPGSRASQGLFNLSQQWREMAKAD